MRAFCSVISLVGLVTATSPLARAQEPDTLSPAQRAGWALARLGGGQRVRIRGSGVGRVEGWVVSNSANPVMLRTDGSRIEVPIPGVDSLWVRDGTHAGTGALIGAAIGGIALGAFASWAVHDLCEGAGNCEETGAFFLGFAIGGTGGAGIGALIGLAFPRWRLRVP